MSRRCPPCGAEADNPFRDGLGDSLLQHVLLKGRREALVKVLGDDAFAHV